MKSVSVIVPTFNRFEELLITLPQIINFIDDSVELIVFDQSNEYNPKEKLDQIEHLLSGTANCRYYHCAVASVPLAWNTAAALSNNDLLIFLDDDVDIDFDFITAHKRKYEANPDIIGVAGGYYASSYNRIWTPSSKNGCATTIAGVNVSFLKLFFKSSGAASNYKKPFAAFDWELAEYAGSKFGKLAVGDDILVFHRAPATGGCGNQSYRGHSWYYGAYHNHFLWMFTREFPRNLTRLPRHFYWLIRYCLPSKNILISKSFFNDVIFKSFRDAYQSYRKCGKKRRSDVIQEENYSLVYCSKDSNKKVECYERRV